MDKSQYVFKKMGMDKTQYVSKNNNNRGMDKTPFVLRNIGALINQKP